MIAVAAAGGLLGGAIEARRMWTQSAEYSRRAMLFGWVALSYEAAREQGRDVEFVRVRPHYSEAVVPTPARSAVLRRQEEHVLRLQQKYERAARYPWLPVLPDPPEPE